MNSVWMTAWKEVAVSYSENTQKVEHPVDRSSAQLQTHYVTERNVSTLSLGQSILC
jgi:hypothetical protein